MSNAARSREAAWVALPERFRWAQAGLYMDLTGLGRPLPSRQLSPPRGVVRVVDGRLVEHRGVGTARLVDAPADLLERFVALRSATDEQLAEFAHAYGFFYFCEHGNPAGVHVDALGGAAVGACAYAESWWHEQSGHTQVLLNAGLTPDDIDRHALPARPDAADGDPCSEWRNLAAEARSCLEVAAALHAARVPQAQHLRPLMFDDADFFRRLIKHQLTDEEVRSAARVALAETVRSWLQHAMVQLVYQWRPSWPDPRLEVGSAGGSRLFGELAMQLAFTTALAGGFVVCAECGDPFTPARRPKLGQRAFCPTCRAGGAPQRAAARDWARRRKESSRG